MKKFFRFLYSIALLTALTNCSNDDDCPEVLEVNINDPASLKRAEACGLSPAEPIGADLWLYKYE